MSAAPDAPVADDPSRPRSPLPDQRPAPGSGSLEVSRVAANVPFVLRTVGGITALALGANVVGVVVVALIIGAMNTTATHEQLVVMLTATGIMLAASVVLGITSATWVQRRTLRWLLRGDRPTRIDTRRAIRLPRDLSVIAAVLWTVDGVVIGPVAASTGAPAQTVSGIIGGTILAGLSSAGVTYLLVGRVCHPVQLLALEANPPQTAPAFGVRSRLLLIWVLTTGLPVIALLLVITAPAGMTHVFGVSIVVAVVALVVGGSSTVLAARAIGQPLRGLAQAFRQVGDGDLGAGVQVEDAGEIGMAQSGFNRMVAGLQERDRVTDLFGRHVGSSVAQEALRSGITLSGESRDVVAVFVDITGSTRLSRERDPKQFVAMLNRFYEIVVDEVDRGGGLLNKFEGDAALCVFGAPVELVDAATSGLIAARRIRDRVFATAEVEVGVGVSAGPVVAGQIGTRSRLEYTVIGDAVNQAARLTDLAKGTTGHLLASGEVVAQAAETERAHWQPVGETVLRGREAATRLWAS